MVILLLVTSFGLAFAEPVLTNLAYQIDQKMVEIVHEPTKNLLISKNCLKTKPISCQAYAKSQLATTSAWKQLRVIEGTNPGSFFCKLLTGKPRWAIDPNGNQVGFCEFPDDSLISFGSLVSLLREKEQGEH